eukprot:CAMPEP_0196589106 /NCGR_PEP_ID=MMETSP1081-20130531/62728_1 /TAXON_ID=36882 /ORGANISM="Pyramimonas amylifera, Strain CCMP720" /LENGTH=112 /DNA_ID=CAMNT_0041911823 /DNA_START=446 /DNA_END=784 /DNA_ORIENTATION=+
MRVSTCSFAWIESLQQSNDTENPSYTGISQPSDERKPSMRSLREGMCVLDARVKAGTERLGWGDACRTRDRQGARSSAKLAGLAGSEWLSTLSMAAPSAATMGGHTAFPNWW